MVVDEGLPSVFRPRAGELQILFAVEGIIGVSACDELLGVLPVYAAALTLAVRRVRVSFAHLLHYLSILIYSFIGDDAAPLERFDYVLLCPGHEAVRVGVLDAYDEVSASLLCIEVVIQRGSHASHMKGAGR